MFNKFIKYIINKIPKIDIEKSFIKTCVGVVISIIIAVSWSVVTYYFPNKVDKQKQSTSISSNKIDCDHEYFVCRMNCKMLNNNDFFDNNNTMASLDYCYSLCNSMLYVCEVSILLTK